jgi:hypothetical protein
MRKAVVGGLALALLAAGCGSKDDGGDGPARLAWDGSPVVRSSPTGARVLIGKVKNDSGHELRITARQVRVLDGLGRPVRSTAIFASGYVRSNYPHNRGPGSEQASYPEPEQERVGYLAVLGDGESKPLTISWREPPGARTAKRIVHGEASLPIPPATKPAAG